MKNIKTFVLAIIILATNYTFAQKQQSLLWEITGNNLEEPSYLFGTIHMMCPDEIEMTPKIMNALERSENLVLEMDMADPSFMPKIQQLSLNKDMKNFSSQLSEDELTLLNDYFKKHYQSDLTKLGIMKPFALMSMMFMKCLDCPVPGSYEGKLMEYANAQKWEIDGLEKIEKQMAVFDNVDTKEQLSWLVNYAKNQDELKKSFLNLVQSYKDENISAIIDIMNDYPEYKNIEDALLYDRNANWIAPIKEYIHNEPTFIGVGAAHLGSERGVIELLRKEGYILTPIID